MMEHPILMNSFTHTNIDTMSELMGSLPSQTISNETRYEHTEFDSSVEKAPPYEKVFNQSDMRQPCLFLKGVVDDCNQSRLLVRMLEYYFVDNDPKSFKSCPCPMANCSKRDFDDPREMIRHLKNCELFSQGLVQCPECDYIDKFRATSKESCSWNPKPSLRHRAQKKLIAAMDTIRKFASSQSNSTTFDLGLCKNCGHRVPVDELFKDPKEFDNRCSNSPVYDPSSIGDHSQDEGCYEMPAKLPFIELDSSPVSSGNILSTDVSPTSTESLTTMSTNNSQGQSLLTNHHQISKSIFDNEQTANTWKQPQSTRQRQSLFIQTNRPGPDMNNTDWGNGTFYTEGTLGPINSLEQLDVASFSSSASAMQAPPPPDIGNYVDAFVPVADMMASTTPYSLNPTNPSSSSAQPPESELSDDGLCCPECGFKPSGIEQNYGAYFQKHLSTHKNPTCKCEICGKIYTRRDNMVVHRRKHHPDSIQSDSEKQKKRKVSYGTTG